MGTIPLRPSEKNQGRDRKRTFNTMQCVKEEKKRKFSVDEGLINFGSFVYGLNFSTLSRELLMKFHRHLGQHRTLVVYYWENIRKDVEEYIKTCLMF